MPLLTIGFGALRVEIPALDRLVSFWEAQADAQVQAQVDAYAGKVQQLAHELQMITTDLAGSVKP